MYIYVNVAALVIGCPKRRLRTCFREEEPLFKKHGDITEKYNETADNCNGNGESGEFAGYKTDGHDGKNAECVFLISVVRVRKHINGCVDVCVWRRGKRKESVNGPRRTAKGICSCPCRKKSKGPEFLLLLLLLFANASGNC